MVSLAAWLVSAVIVLIAAFALLCVVMYGSLSLLAVVLSAVEAVVAVCCRDSGAESWWS